MKYKKIIVLLILSLISLAFNRQDVPKHIVIKVKSDFFNVDNIGNIYTVKEDELMKFLPSGKFFARYSNLKFGNISSIDATNPLKLLLYYHDFQQIVFLDNQLSVNSENVSLEKLGYEQTDLACASANNSFWIYDKQNNELIRFNENSKKISYTGNLKQILQTELTPNFMLEHNGYLFLNCQDNGIYVFDIFGAFSKVISIKNLKRFQINETIVYYQKDSLFCSYNYKTFDEICKNLNNTEADVNAKLINGNLILSYEDSIVVKKMSK